MNGNNSSIVNTLNHAVQAARLISEELLYLRVRPQPESPRGLTGWFLQHIRENAGYVGVPVFFDNELRIHFATGPKSMPNQEDLDLSDAKLFSLFDTAFDELFDDGTSEITFFKDEEDRERYYREKGCEQQDHHEDDEGDWDM